MRRERSIGVMGDINALDWDTGPNGIWRAFPNGTITHGTGGDVHLKLCDTPVSTRWSGHPGRRQHAWS